MSESRACELCGAPFQPKKPQARFCSAICRQRAWHDRNREHVNESQRAWNAQNRVKMSAQAKARRALSGDKMNEQARARYRANSERDRERRNAEGRRKRHGHSIDGDLALMRQEQAGCCYLCGEVMTQADKQAIDHDHSCCPQGKSCRICRRGLAHDRCNIAIGNAGDDPDRLRRMADALEVAQLAFRQRRAASGTREQFPLSR